MAEFSGVQSVVRAFELIELLCKKGSMGITELSKESGLHKTTVYRMLGTLCELGYVGQDANTEEYSLTLKFLKISSSLLLKSDIRQIARPVLEKLSHTLGETVHLVEQSGSKIIYIDKYESLRNSVQMVSRIGLSLPMIYTAVGKAILAHMDNGDVRQVWDSTKIEKRTPHTITDFNTFLTETEAIRRQGYAEDNEENELGVRCIAAALPDIYGSYRYAFSVSAPVSRMDKEKLKTVISAVCKARQEIEDIIR